jgi:hypothetical protein
MISTSIMIIGRVKGLMLESSLDQGSDPSSSISTQR